MAFDFDEGGALITPKASSSKSGFDFDESGLPVSAKPIEKSPGLIDTIIGANQAVASSYAERSGQIAQGIGEFLQAPAANTLAGLAGLKSAAVRALVGNKVADTNKDFAGVREDVRDTSAFALSERTKNVAEGDALATSGKWLETEGKGAKESWGKTKGEVSPMMIRQQKEIDEAKGFVDKSVAMITNPLGTVGSVAGSLPDMVMGMGAGSVAARLVAKSGIGIASAIAGREAVLEAGMKTATMAERNAIASGVSEIKAAAIGMEAGEKAIIDAAKNRVAGSAGLLSESASSALSTKQGVSDFVEKQPHELLEKNSARYRELTQTLTPKKARAQLAEELGNESSLAAGIFTGAVNKLTGSAEAIGKTVASGKASGADVVKGTAKGAAEEAAQSPGEAYFAHQAKVQADPAQEYDFGGEVAGGLISGAVMSGGIHGAGYLGAKATEAKPVTEVPPPVTPAAQTEQQIQSEQSNTDDLLAQVKALHPEQAAETILSSPDVDVAIAKSNNSLFGDIRPTGETTNAKETAEAIPLETKQPEAPAAGLIGREANGIQPERANAEMVTPGAEVGRDVVPGGRPVEQVAMPGGTGGGIQPAEVSAPGGGKVATVRNVEQQAAVKTAITEAKANLERADAQNDLDAIYNASVKLDEVVTQEVERKSNSGEMSVFKGKNMTYAVHPATDGSGKWQVTRYSDTGAQGDSRHETIKGAVKYEELSKHELLEGKEAEAELARVGRAEGEYQQRKALTATPTAATAGKQPAARRIQDPHELGQSVFTGKAKAVGLTDKQIEALLPEEPRDSVTGFFRAENKVPTVERAQKHSAETGVPTQFVDVDIANLGGINKRFKNNHAKANKFYRMLSDIAHEELSKVGDQIIPIRHGGDEFSFVIANGTKESIDKARDRIKNRVKQLAVESGLDTEPHTKPGQPPGIGLHIGYAEIRENETLDEVFARAALGVDESKTGAGYVTKEEGRDATEVLRDERPAGTGAAQAAIPARVGTEGQGTPGKVTETPGATGVADDVASAFTFNNDGTLKVEGHDKAFLKKVAKKLRTDVIFNKDGSAVFGKNTNQDKLDSILKNGIQVDAAKSAAAKARMNAGVDSSKDSLFTAIAKLGGLNKIEARSTWGLDNADRFNSGVLGKHVLTDGGESLDGMRELLVERGYLRDDDSLTDFESMFRKEQQGDKQYTDAAVERMAEESHREQMANEGAAALGIRGTNKGKRTVEVVELEIEKILSERTAQERESIAALERVPAEELIAEFDLPPIEAYQHESRIEGIDRGEETVGTHPEEPAQETGAGRNAPEGVEGGEGFDLEGQTEAEAIAERNRLRDIENQPQVAETAAKKADDEKAKADERARVLAAHEADRDNFFGQNAREAADPNKPLFSRGVEPTRTPKEITKDRNELKSIFEGLGRSLGTASKKAKEAAADHPKSEIINHIQDNFYDILAKMEDAGKVEINC